MRWMSSVRTNAVSERTVRPGGVFFFLPSSGWGKIKLKLTTLPRIFIRVVCRFNSVAYHVILEPGIGQFRKFESPRVHTRIHS